MGIGLLTLISSISLTVGLLTLATVLAIWLPKGDKRIAIYIYGIALLVGGSLTLMSWMVYRWGW